MISATGAGATPPRRGVAPGRSQQPLSVLVIEDEPPIRQLVATYLQAEGFSVVGVGDGESGLEQARESSPDVIVLDLMLPGMDGIEVCRRIRTFSDAYIIMLTAKTEEIDRLIGLSVGADDYLGKPFSPRELVARVRAMLRRPRTTETAPAEDVTVRFGDLVVDPAGREVSLAGEPLDLTRTEFDLLEVLSAHPRQAFSREQLAELVWGYEVDAHVVDVHVANLRRKLGDDPQTSRYVRTMRGVGYRMGTGQ